MKKNRSGNWVALALLVLAGAFGYAWFNKGKEAQANVIAVIPKGTGSMWWEVVHKGALDAAAKAHYEIVYVGPELETDREKQIQSIDDVLVKGVRAVVLGPNDSKALVRPVQMMKEQKMPVVIIDSGVDTSEDDYYAFVATDNYAGGADGARRLAAALGGKGKVIIAKFVQNSASTDARALGFKETLAKEFPDMTVVDEQFSLGTVEDARQRTVDMLARNPDIKGLFAVNHPSSVGAYKALQSEGVAGKIRMVGFDSDPILLDAIKKGEVEALIVQNPYEIGYQGVMMAIAAINGETRPKKIPIASMIVDNRNMIAMKEKFPAALGL